MKQAPSLTVYHGKFLTGTAGVVWLAGCPSGGDETGYHDTRTTFENPESERVEDYMTGKSG